jgi:hypothetical protein
MKKIGLLLVLLLASLSRLSAQVTVEVTLDQDQFLPGESLPVTVRITNRSGQTLRLGNDPHWLTFAVESHNDFIIVKTGKVPVLGAFTLDSSMRAIKRVDLAPYFDMTKPGRYTVIATVTIKAWNQQISSDPKAFDVIQGANIWEQQIGVPVPAGATNRTPDVRTYALQQANYLRKRLMLYVRLTDATGKINKVFPIGPMLSFGQPEPQVDRMSNLHVLYQDGPRSFSYTVINPDGDLILHQTFGYTTRPRLTADGDGNITVVGGLRQVKSDDVPPPRPEVDKAKTPAP